VRSLGQPAHYFKHDRAADTVVPSLGKVAMVGQDGEVGDGRDGIAGRNAQSSNVCGIARTGIEKKLLPLSLALRVMRRDVRVPDVGDGGHRSLGAHDHPALVGQRSVKPIAEHLHGDKSVGTDAANHAPDFVHVGIKHDSRARVSLLRDDGAQTVVTYLVGERAHAIGHDFAHRFFISRRAGDFGEFFQELHNAVRIFCGGWRPLSVDLAGQAERQQAGKHSPHDGWLTSWKMIDEGIERRYGKVREDDVFRRAVKARVYFSPAIRECQEASGAAERSASTS